ncbi:MAG: CoA transferase [Deltaproteobacteria bacterium]|nr:CoA transferase [Deltaproteobacteria bacterium]
MSALDDITVLELAFYYPGPLCGLVLSDLGAEVIKVEAPDGDPMRHYGSRDGEPIGANFKMFNRGKKSAVIDLKTDGGRRDFLALVSLSDVLLQVLRPSAMERLGLGRDRIQEANPRIVHCLISGYGASGPYADRAGHDVNYESLAGIPGMTGARSGELALSGVPLADMTGALLAAISILGALRERDRTSHGKFIDVSLTEGAVLANALQLVGVLFPGEEPGPRTMLLNGLFPTYNLYSSRDGRWFALGAIEPKFWVEFVTAAGREDLMGLQYDPSAVEKVRELFASRDGDEWERLAREHDVCLEPVLGRDEVLSHPQHAARSVFEQRDGSATHVRITGLEKPQADRLRTPALGEHTDDVLARIKTR